MLKIGIMQPYFFPYLAYWQLINYVDKYIIYDDVNYIKNGWINRNYILLNNERYLLTLPLDKASHFLRINQIKFTSDFKKKESLIKTLIQAYKKAPYFLEIFPIVENMIMDKSMNLSFALTNSIYNICNYLDIKTEIVLSSSIEKNDDLKGEEKILHICELLGADAYINAIGGLNLYTAENFINKNISLKFLKMNDIVYTQFKNDFVSSLSIIDVLMFNSKDKVKSLLNEFVLVE